MSFQGNPTLTVALALALGMVAQSLARHLRIPGIVLLLATGVLVGPEGAGWVHPDSLGSGLYGLVGFAVAVILFEGGLRLELRRLRREPKVIRRLVTVGALLTALGGALAAHFFLGWSWRLSVLFGTLVIVTGPTVVTPLLRRLRVQRTIGTVLEAEGVLIDAVGAITAAVALEVTLYPFEGALLLGIGEILLRLAFGATAGLAGGLLLSFALRPRRLIPEGLPNVLTLGLVLLIYEFSNAVVHESGIAAVTVAGIVVANIPSHVHRPLVAFKEQLSILLIGMLFVLLAADVKLENVTALGWPGLAAVSALVFVVRPLVAFICAAGTGLTGRERVFLSWIAPRGVIAAAMASLFAFELSRVGIAGGPALRGLVFATIALTVVWTGLTGIPVVRLLGLRRRVDAGWIVLGGSALAQQLAELIRAGSEEVLCLDSDPQQVVRMERSGLRTLHGNALESHILARAELEARCGGVAVTENEEANLLFVQKASARAPELRYLVAITDWDQGVTPDIVHAQGAEVLFGGQIDIARWSRRLARHEAKLRWWKLNERRSGEIVPGANGRCPYVPLAVRRKTAVTPFGSRTRLRRGDCVAFLIDEALREEAKQRLLDAGYVPSDEPIADHAA